MTYQKKAVILRSNLKLNNMKTTAVVTASKLKEMIENTYIVENKDNTCIIHASKERILKFVEKRWGSYDDIIIL